MNLIADGYLLEKHRSQRLVEIEKKQRVVEFVSDNRRDSRHLLASIGNFFHLAGRLRKIRIQVSFDVEALSPDGQLV